ncbi:MAG TPA: PrgI family protein [Candidatus Saccharibacteria bacterium]|nr:PrgI family protein [Candidatus Saccharibacteria bacterium]
MAEYKVIQDIEAEDKLLGPFTLRQFIYASIVVTIGFVGFFFIKENLWFMTIPLIPPLIFFLLLAAPFGRDQSSEIWLLGKVRFFLFTKKRLWDQEGIEHLVKVTVPKKIEKHYSDGLSKSEVNSRLKTLANTMDTRGWIVKNVVPGNRRLEDQQNNDRLLEIQKTPEDDALAAIKPAADMLNTSTSNPLAAQLTNMVDESELIRRQQLLSNMQSIAENNQIVTPNLVTPSVPNSSPARVSAPAPRIILKSSPARQDTPAYATPQTTTQTTSQNTTKQPMTPPAVPDILNGVNKRKLSSEIDVTQDSEVSNGDTDDEVVVSLH